MKNFIKASDILAKVCDESGIRRFVVCPGSRSAPLVLAITQYSAFEINVLNDERSAGYAALGWSLSEKAPVGIITTSGTAVLNLGPALAEAYYQNVPLFAVTADRPAKFIDKNDGQTIRQKKIFKRQIPASYNVIGDIKTQKQYEKALQTIVKSVKNCTQMQAPMPVHLNIAFDEPLYTQPKKPSSVKIKSTAKAFAPTATKLKDTNNLLQDLQNYNSIWLMPGANINRQISNEQAEKLAQLPGVAVFANHLCNWPQNHAIAAFNAVLQTNDIPQKLLPQLIVTTTGAILSKKIKVLLRKHKIDHWHISQDGKAIDTFFSLKKSIQIPENDFIKLLVNAFSGNKTFSAGWQNTNLKINRFFGKAEAKLWTDITAMRQIFDIINQKSVIHLSNSSPVRYAEWALKMSNKNFRCHANRGTAGIDGCSSTAAGFSMHTKQDVWLFTGDHAFQYDANALWNKKLSGNFKIVILNNGGGNIFRLITKTYNTKLRERYFEAAEKRNFANLAAHFNCSYFSASNFLSLERTLQSIDKAKKDRPIILELFTDAKQNENYYFSIIDQLKQMRYE